jgi:hypothetical protein
MSRIVPIYAPYFFYLPYLMPDDFTRQGESDVT